ncbi:universal stress protein [Halorarius litoreus]|uniref:universal stress protein n=1 Tax=Halorarius litoreus TaxID=2962676 RepID=UPI0020CED857|nr:universal stress protein [Halorarius litoreus]
MYDTILVPTDGSEVSERAAQEAFGLASELGASVHVLFVIDESASSFLLTTETMSSVLEELRETGEEATEAAAAFAEDVPVETAVVRGMNIHGTIVDYAEDHGVDLVVMGTHGRHGVEHIVGSTTQRVLTSTSIPVLVVGEKGA